LLPVFNIPDRAIIAYEAIPRLRAPSDRLSVLRSALEAVRFATPAVLLMPTFGDLLDELGIAPAQLAAEHGANASDVAWVISNAAEARNGDSIDEKVAELRAAGFLVAFEARGWATEWHEHIAAFRPDFLLLDAPTVAQGLGTTFGMIFGSLIGALSITNEIRNGMIRPTLLAMPNRNLVIAAKVMASLIAGAVLGLLAEAIAIGVGSAGLAVRGIGIAPSVGDFAQLLVGGAAAAALWAAIGVGVGATIRSQIGAAISLVVWLLFIEMTVIGVAPGVGKFLPGASGGALAGAMLQQTATYLLVPALGALLIVAYATVAIGAGLITTARRDIT